MLTDTELENSSQPLKYLNFLIECLKSFANPQFRQRHNTARSSQSALKRIGEN